MSWSELNCKTPSWHLRIAWCGKRAHTLLDRKWSILRLFWEYRGGRSSEFFLTTPNNKNLITVTFWQVAQDVLLLKRKLPELAALTFKGPKSVAPSWGSFQQVDDWARLTSFVTICEEELGLSGCNLTWNQEEVTCLITYLRMNDCKSAFKQPPRDTPFLCGTLGQNHSWDEEYRRAVYRRAFQTCFDHDPQ